MFNKISLNSLKIFYYVALDESLNQASKRLLIEKSAIIYHIKIIENYIEKPLFERRNKSLCLTVEGKKLFDSCKLVFNKLDQCLINLNRNKTRKDLIIACEATIYLKWLIPRIQKFNQMNFGFSLTILTFDNPKNFKNKNIDLIITNSDSPWGEYIFSKKIIDEFMLEVYIKGHNSKNLIISNCRPKLKYLITKNYKKNNIINKIEFDHFFLCIEACLSGLGKTITSGFMIEYEIKNNILQVENTINLYDSAYYLLSNSPFNDDIRKIIFRDWIIKEMKITKKILLTNISPILIKNPLSGCQLKY